MGSSGLSVVRVSGVASGEKRFEDLGMHQKPQYGWY